MSEKPTDHTKGTLHQSRAARRVCRTAYMIGDRQPVRCTLIGDEPLFYMDFESEMVEQEALEQAAQFDDRFAYAGIEKNLVALREENCFARQLINAGAAGWRVARAVSR